MKFIIMMVFVFLIVALPLYMLDSLVMPQLVSLQNSYAHADEIANRVAQTRADAL